MRTNIGLRKCGNPLFLTALLSIVGLGTFLALAGPVNCPKVTESGNCNSGNQSPSCQNLCTDIQCTYATTKVKLCLGSGATQVCKDDAAVAWVCTGTRYRMICKAAAGGNIEYRYDSCGGGYACIGCDTAGPSKPGVGDSGVCTQAYYETGSVCP